ncbi:hypothetical protein LXL04_017618 [Taraxacum kok-saghyz]
MHNERLGEGHVLQQKSLITIDDNKRVGMHDHIEEMGRNIVRRPHHNRPRKHSRLWKENEIKHILTNQLGTEETRCICFNAMNLNTSTVMKGIGMMKSLRFLYVVLRTSYGRGGLYTFIPSFPDALGFLRVVYYPFKYLPKTFQGNNLVTLEIPFSAVQQLWEGGEHKVLDKLRFLDFSNSRHMKLDPQLTPNLEIINLSGCHGLLGGMWTLKHLISLDLHGSRLRNLPEDIGRSRCLENLSLSNTNITHLPDSICMLRHLKYIKLDGCKRVEKLPKNLGLIDSLENLILSSTKIKHLPNNICKLKHLQSLNLSDCIWLEKLPEDIDRLKCLKGLYMKGTCVHHLPESILSLKGLCIYGSRGFLRWVGFTIVTSQKLQ